MTSCPPEFVRMAIDDLIGWHINIEMGRENKAMLNLKMAKQRINSQIELMESTK